MMISIRKSSKLTVLVLILMISVAGCKSKKKAMDASNVAAEKTRMEQEATARKQQEKEEQARRKDAEERERREAEARKSEAEAKARTPQIRLTQYFDAIAGAGNTATANNSIAEALTLFASPETPVLIVISESAGVKDYDRPTNIKDYLNYLKDQKKNNSTISDLKFGSSGKITEVELRKSF